MNPDIDELVRAHVLGNASEEQQAKLAECLSLDASIAIKLREEARLESALDGAFREQVVGLNQLTECPPNLRRRRLLLGISLAASLVIALAVATSWLGQSSDDAIASDTVIVPQTENRDLTMQSLLPRHRSTKQSSAQLETILKNYIIPEVDWRGLTVEAAVRSLEAEVKEIDALANQPLQLSWHYDKGDGPARNLSVRRYQVRLLHALRYLAAVSERDLILNGSVRFKIRTTNKQTPKQRKMVIPGAFLEDRGLASQPERPPFFTELKPFPLYELTTHPDDENSEDNPFEASSLPKSIPAAELLSRLQAWGVEGDLDFGQEDRLILNTAQHELVSSILAMIETKAPEMRLRFTVWSQEHAEQSPAGDSEVAREIPSASLEAYRAALEAQEGTTVVQMPSVTGRVGQAATLESLREVISRLPNVPEAEEAWINSWSGTKARIESQVSGDLLTVGLVFENRGNWLGFSEENEQEPQFDGRHVYASYIRFDGSPVMEITIPGENRTLGILVDAQVD